MEPVVEADLQDAAGRGRRVHHVACFPGVSAQRFLGEHVAAPRERIQHDAPREFVDHRHDDGIGLLRRKQRPMVREGTAGKLPGDGPGALPVRIAAGNQRIIGAKRQRALAADQAAADNCDSHVWAPVLCGPSALRTGRKVLVVDAPEGREVLIGP